MIGLIYAVCTMLAIVIVTGLAAFTYDVARAHIAANRAARGAVAAQVDRERAPFMDEAKREIDRMLAPWDEEPSPQPAIVARQMPPWERIGGRLDPGTRTIHIPGFKPCSEMAWALNGYAALEPLHVDGATIRSIRRAVKHGPAREGEHLVEFTTVDGIGIPIWRSRG